MAELYPSQILMKRYCPVRDIHDYYEDLDESVVMDLVNTRRVHYAYFKDPKGGYFRVLHVDMLDVLTTLGRDTTIKHIKE